MRTFSRRSDSTVDECRARLRVLKLITVRPLRSVLFFA
jgi:hypothetical protein